MTVMDPVRRIVEVILARPLLAERFARKTSPERIDAFVAAIGLPVPPEMLAFYREIDGTRTIYDADSDTHLPTESEPFADRGLAIQPLEMIVENKSMWDGFAGEFEASSPAQRRERFHLAFWNTAWIPFASNHSNCDWAIATEPCFGGPAGQIIQFDYKGRDFWEIEHRSFGDFLLTIAQLLEDDVPEYDEREDEIRRRLNPDAAFVMMPLPPPPLAERFELPRTPRYRADC
jgi:cell wall assembly regulator SMI1